MNATQFEQVIHKWVVDNFCQSEADEPSWNIRALANHLAIKQRLEELRQSLQAENISYGELQTLAKYIEADDVELLEAAGVPEAAK